jgi:hypothetical protein
MINAGIKVRVIRYLGGKMERALVHGGEEFGRVPPDLIAAAALIEHVGGLAAQIAQRSVPEGKQTIKRSFLQGFHDR